MCGYNRASVFYITFRSGALSQQTLSPLPKTTGIFSAVLRLLIWWGLFRLFGRFNTQLFPRHFSQHIACVFLYADMLLLCCLTKQHDRFARKRNYNPFHQLRCHDLMIPFLTSSASNLNHYQVFCYIFDYFSHPGTSKITPNWYNNPKFSQTKKKHRTEPHNPNPNANAKPPTSAQGESPHSRKTSGCP